LLDQKKNIEHGSQSPNNSDSVLEPPKHGKKIPDALNNQQTLSRLELPECIYKSWVVVGFGFFAFVVF
jgi:hypothetical protein